MTQQFPEGAHSFNPVILRAYDIRGIVGESLHAEDAYAIGRALATYIIREGEAEAPKIGVAYDGRLSSPELEEALVAGIAGTGAIAVRVGLGPTPMLYFAVNHLDLDGGVMITGSHNPPTHNGFKMMQGKRALFGEDIQELGVISNAGEFPQGEGKVVTEKIADDYLKALREGFEDGKAKQELRVVWDAGNGAAGDMMARLTKELPGEHILLNEEIDGTFPAHHPDPSDARNLEQLIDVVKQDNCDLGVAFDGDGDRVGVVDSQGRILWGDQMMILYARDVLADHPGATVIADVKASQTLFDAVKEMGGEPVIWKTGHSFIKAKMVETKAALAGEMSGHIFFADKYYGYDDGIYGAVRLINLVAKSDQSLDEMVDVLPHTYNTPEMRIDCPEERKFAIIEEVAARLQAQGQAYSDIDGVRVMMEQGWWLLRASNTQAALVARCEATDEVALAKIKASLTEQLEQSDIALAA